MTAASGADQPTLRDQLIARLTEAQHAPHSAIPVPDGLYEHEIEAVIDALLPLIEAARERAKVEALEKAADWLNADPDKGGAPYIAGDDSVLFPHRLDIAEVVAWAAASLRDRAASLRAATGQPPDRPAP